MTEATGKGTVQIAYLHSEHVSHSWVESMRGMLEYDLDHGKVLARKPLNMRCGVAMVAHVRNGTCRLFLDKTDHEWLLFVDTDMGFAPDSVHRLLEVADPVERPVVGALCFASMVSGHDGMGGWRRTIVPTMYKMGTTATGEPSFCFFGDYEDDTVTQVAATGGAFLLIHRGALEKLRAEHGDHWFDMMYDSVGDIVGEDIAFCGRLLKAGIIPAVHTGVKTTHHKEIWLSEEDYELQRAVTLTVDPVLPPAVDLGASLASLAANAHVREDGMLKLAEDLNRHKAIIEATKPEVIVETGTRTGASARWFLTQPGVREVISVDVNNAEDTSEVVTDKGRLTFLRGNSADAALRTGIQILVGDRRCMVVLDSDHSAAHVAREIELYGPLVSEGCYLVVEDTIFGHAPQAIRDMHIPGQQGSPLDAVVELLHGNADWSRDMAIERMSAVSHHPGGWWIRNG